MERRNINEKNEKTCFGIASTGALLVPLIVVSSCSSSSSTTDYTISPKTNPVVNRVDIEGEKYQQLATLEKLFDGIREDNIEFFTVSIDPEVSDQEATYTITLTANEGYTVNGELEVSNEFTVEEDTILDITPIADIELTQDEFNDLNDGDLENDLPVLERLFKGLDDTNIANVEVKYNKGEETITLTAVTGFIFTDGSTITATFTVEAKDTILDITPIANIVLAQGDFDILNDDIDPSNDLPVLEKLFSGLNDTNFTNVEVEYTKGEKTISLNAVEGFAFEDGKSSISVTFKVLLDITVNTDVELTHGDFDILNDDDLENDLPVLQKLFGGLDDTSFANVEVGYTKGEKTISLTAVTGFAFTNGPTITATFTVQIIDLEMNLKQEPYILNSTDIEILNGWMTGEMVVYEIIFQKIFNENEVTQEKIKNIDKVEVSEAENKITFTTKPGFIFNETDKNSITIDYQLEEPTTIANKL